MCEYRFANDAGTYNGRMKGNFFEGHGKMRFRDGSQFIGFWRNSKQNGQGRMLYGNGTALEGNWENGELQK